MVLTRTITVLTLVSFILYLYGCYSISTVELSINNLEEVQDSEILAAVSTNYEIFQFERSDLKPKPRIVDSTLIGWTKTIHADKSYSLKEVHIPISNVKIISFEEKNVAVGLIVGVVGLGLLLYWILTAEWNIGKIDLSDFKYRGM